MKRTRFTISLLAMLSSLMANAGNNYVDLGLPSGLLWATCNLGADTPEQFGNYYDWINDPVQVYWDNVSRTPTKAERDELVQYCTYSVETLNGIKGARYTGSNGQSIFFPFAGYYQTGNGPYKVGEGGQYWTITAYSETAHWILATNNATQNDDNAYYWPLSYFSFPVRPVTSEIPTEESSDILINEENFPDENFRAFLKEQSYGEDDILTEEEINSIIKINVRNKKINSLKGVEFFTTLDSLVCSFNQLTNLDVSSCTALTTLDCRHNQLTDLDVSKNTALKSLVGNYNKLASLDVSNNTALTRLHCCSNQLTSLDVTKNTALTSLDCRGNQLTGLDVSNNTALTELWCNGNQLKSLDVSNNTALTELGCGGNQLTSLDVLGCTALTKLTCDNNLLTSLDVSKNIALTGLNCYNNQLTSLDVSKNTALTSLDVSKNTALTSLNCNENQLTSLNVSGCTALTTLNCNDNQLTGLDVSGCTALTTLNCNDNQLTGLDVSGCTALTTLHCSDNQIKGAKMDALVSTLPIQNQAKLYIINPSSAQEGNICTKDQVNIARKRGWRVYKSTGGYYDGSESEDHIIIKINEENFPDEKFREYLMNEPYGKDGVLTEEEISGITTLNVSNMGISDLKGIEYFTALKKLLCYKNNLTELNLSANKQLKEVDCYSNQIMGNKMDSLIASLPTLSEGEGSLYVLDATDEGNICFTEQVSYAKSKGWIVYYYTGSEWQEYEGREPGILITEENFPDKYFREYLMKQDYGKDMIITDDEIKTLTSIYINDYFYMADKAEGEITSLKGIEHFTYLQSLYCVGNKLTNLDISENGQLTTLSCFANQLTELDVSKNTELIEIQCGYNALTSLDLSNNTALTAVYCVGNRLTNLNLPNNSKLTSLSCHNNKISSIDLSNSKELTWLNCASNQLTDIDISKNTALTFLYCASNNLINLDVSKNSALEELACMSNQLTKLDVSKNPKLKTIKCQGNKINGKRMDQLIESLPVHESAVFCVIDDTYFHEENICTKKQVKKAKEKGWKVMCGYDGFDSGSGPEAYHPHYIEYEGSESGDIYIDEETFPDEHFRAYLLNQFYGKDGYISEEEIGTITGSLAKPCVEYLA